MFCTRTVDWSESTKYERTRGHQGCDRRRSEAPLIVSKTVRRWFGTAIFFTGTFLGVRRDISMGYVRSDEQHARNCFEREPVAREMFVDDVDFSYEQVKCCSVSIYIWGWPIRRNRTSATFTLYNMTPWLKPRIVP